MKFFIRMLSLTMLLFSMHGNAEQFKNLGDWEVHYMVLDTTFLTPEVANAYGIVRSRNSALVNISVLNKRNKKAQPVSITGNVRDLLGSEHTLAFKEVTEGDAIYYLATLPFEDKEHYRFNIEIRQDTTRQVLKFEQKLYKE